MAATGLGYEGAPAGAAAAVVAYTPGGWDVYATATGVLVGSLRGFGEDDS